MSMVIRTFDKNGEPGTCFRNVESVKLMVIPAYSISETLLNLCMTVKGGETIDFYLSGHERFAVIDEEEEP